MIKLLRRLCIAFCLAFFALWAMGSDLAAIVAACAALAFHAVKVEYEVDDALNGQEGTGP